jgi:electron transfer flavoprotein beta subunit
VQLDKLGIDLSSNLEIVKTESPAVRSGGVVVPDVDTLLNKLKNEAKVL